MGVDHDGATVLSGRSGKVCTPYLVPAADMFGRHADQTTTSWKGHVCRVLAKRGSHFDNVPRLSIFVSTEQRPLTACYALCHCGGSPDFLPAGGRQDPR